MRVVIQRVSEASVKIDGVVKGEINQGMMILLGIEHDDSEEDIDWLVAKLSGLRIFNDAEGKMNVSIREIKGSFLVVSQFTLHASTRKGNRPSYVRAARPELAIPMYELFIERLRKSSGLEVQTGEFGADMKVTLINDGPVTILIDSKTRE